MLARTTQIAAFAGSVLIGAQFADAQPRSSTLDNLFQGRGGTAASERKSQQSAVVTAAENPVGPNRTFATPVTVQTGSTPKVIYGNDDRHDLKDETNDTYRKLAASVCILVPGKGLAFQSDGSATI